MEKFATLFKSYKELYTYGSPLIITAGALLKHNESGKVFVQLKMKNISPKIIKAVKVSVRAFDSFGNEIEGIKDYQYLDISAKRNTEFGNKQLITLPDSTTRSFSVACTEVLFDEGKSDLLDENAEWKEIPEQKELEVIGHNLAEQYRRETFPGAKFIPEGFEDVWCCTCGAINKDSENGCCVCGYDKERQMLAFNRENLALHFNEYKKVQAEKAEAARVEAMRKAEEERIARQKRNKKAIKITAIVLAIVAVIAIAAALFVFLINPMMKYDYASKMMEEGYYAEAASAFEKLDGFKDSEEMVQNCYIELLGEEGYDAWKNINPGDYVYFGDYHDAAEWLVLEKDGTKFLVISKECIDCKLYNEKNKSVTWETCSLREWLNNDFVAEAFSDEERKVIVETNLSNPDNADKETDGGNDTSDQVFLLSVEEAEKYFATENKRKCTATEYAKEQHVYTSNNKYAWWWLRTPGNAQSQAAQVDNLGNILLDGVTVTSSTRGVRPAMWIDMSLSSEKVIIKADEKGKEIMDERKYQEAAGLIENANYAEAIVVLNKIKDYKDSANLIEECQNIIDEEKYVNATALFENGEYDAAISAFKEIKDYKDSAEQIETIKKEKNYQEAVSLMNEGKYKKAMEVFEQIEDYKDSAKKIKTCKNKINGSSGSGSSSNKNSDENKTEEYGYAIGVSSANLVDGYWIKSYRVICMVCGKEYHYTIDFYYVDPGTQYILTCNCGNTGFVTFS